MDEVFGSENFVSQITVARPRRGSSTERRRTAPADYVALVRQGSRRRSSIGSSLRQERSAATPASVLEYCSRRDATGMTRAERRASVRDCLTAPTISIRRPDVDRRRARCALCPVEVRRTDVHAAGSGGWKTHRAGMERLIAAGRVAPSGKTLWLTSAFADDFPVIRLTNLWTDTRIRSRARQDLRRPDAHQGHRAVHADVHRPRRPRARPDLRQRHDRVRGRAVGASLDHRSTPRGSRLRWPASGSWAAQYPWYLLADSAGGHAKEQSLTAQRSPAATVHWRHPARLRLRAGPAHHAQVDREQSRHQGRA